jgi:hypothetical protein
VADDDVLGLLTRYRTVLVEMHAQSIETGGTPRKWNRLVDRMQRLHLELRDTPSGRAGITDLALNGENDTVRGWSATNALAWDPEIVRPVLEARALDPLGLGGLEAEIVLREYDAGRLNTMWVPKRA